MIWERYREWARATRMRDDHERVPLALSPFVRLFGGFVEAAVQAGVEANAHLSAAAHGRRWYTTEEILAALRGASRDLGERALTINGYERWRRALLDEARGRGSRLSLPSDVAIFEHYPRWADALQAAGLITEQEAELVGRRRRPLTENRVARALLAFVRESEETTRTDYGRWRLRQPRHLGTRDAPDAWAMVRRFAPWAALLELVEQANRTEDPQRELERLLAEHRQ